MPPKILTLPVVTRDILNFKQGATYSLIVQSQSISAGTITIRGATTAGLFVFQHTALSTRAIKSESFSIPDVPLWVSVIDSSNIYSNGGLFIRLNFAINGDIIQQLASGYVNGGSGISWPSTNLKSPTPIAGQLRTIVGTNPGAGVEISETVPANVMWKLKSIRFTLVTAVTAATRRVHLTLTDDITLFIDLSASTSQIASLTRSYNLLEGATNELANIDNEIYGFIPFDTYLMPNTILATLTTLLQAGDDFSAPTMWVEEYLLPV